MNKPLTISTQDYLKHIYELTENGESASTTALAKKLNISAPSVTGMVQKLAAEIHAMLKPRHPGLLTVIVPRHPERAEALAQEFAVEIASGVLELAGASATDRKYGLDRHWRNVRVHSLHDPARWKYVHLGNNTLHGTRPPRLGVLL